MKESFGRITTWAKEHPYWTALILGVVILLAWLAYRRHSMVSNDATSADQTGDATQTVQGVGELGQTLPSMASGGEITVPATGGYSDGGNSTPVSFGGDGGFAYPQPDTSYTDTMSPSTPPSNYFVPASPMPEKSPKVADAAIKSSIVGTSGATIKTAQNNNVQGVANASAGIAPKIEKSSIGSTVSAKAGKKSAEVAIKPVIYTTPASRLGLSAFYTGLYQGVRYNLGYPMGSPVLGVASSSVGSKTVTTVHTSSHRE